MRQPALNIGRFRVSHDTMRLCLLLLPIWLAGAGELTRFAWLNTVPGSYERNGFVKGRDFVQFYVAGTLAREGSWAAMYDVASLERAIARVVPAARGEVAAPVYGPQVAAFFAPLSELPYLPARWVWCAVSLLIYLAAAGLVIRGAAPLRQHRVLTWMTVVLNPTLSLLLSTGQTSGLALLAWAAAAVAFSRGRTFIFGASLGILAFKPPLLVGAVPVLVVLRQWRALAGATLSVAVQVAAGLAVTGVDAWFRYLSSAASMSSHYFLTDTVPHQKHSLSGFLQLLFDSNLAVFAVVGLAACGNLVLWWVHRRHVSTVWFLPMLAATTVLLSPHLYVYDLLVLMPALLVAAHALSRSRMTTTSRMVAWSGYALLYAPFSGGLAEHTGVQLSTLAMLAFLIAVHRHWNASTAQREEQAGSARA